MTAALARHARALWLAAILITLGGVVAAFNLPVSLFPQIDYPRVVVSIAARLGLFIVILMPFHFCEPVLSAAGRGRSCRQSVGISP